MKERTPFDPLSDEAYEKQVREHEVVNLKKKAAKLGFTVVAAAALSETPQVSGQVGTVEGVDPKLHCKAVPGSIHPATDSSGGGKHWSRRHPVLIYEAGLKRINIGARTTD